MKSPQNHEPTEVQKNTLTSETITLVIAEYSALRDEILKRIELQHQITSLALIAPGTILVIGLQVKSAILILLYPILAMFLSVAWTREDRAIMLIGAYIKKRIESKVGNENMGWEHFVSEHYSKANKLPGTSLNVLTARGIFLGTELLAILVGLSIANFDITITLILIIDIISILITIIFLGGVPVRDRLKNRLKRST